MFSSLCVLVFKLCVLIRWYFNFCVRSSPLRGSQFDSVQQTVMKTFCLVRSELHMTSLATFQFIQAELMLVRPCRQSRLLPLGLLRQLDSPGWWYDNEHCYNHHDLTPSLPLSPLCLSLSVAVKYLFLLLPEILVFTSEMT